MSASSISATDETTAEPPREPEASALDDERPEAQRVTREKATLDAVALLREARNGVLGTLSHRDEGAPFGSVAPYALDRTGAPLIFIAEIAEHTRNLRADPRVSLLVHEDAKGEEDIQSKARLTVMGRAAPVGEADAADAWARYRARLPAARGYERTHDFSLWRIEPLRMRWIGGFGEIFWLRVEDFRVLPDEDALCPSAAGIVQHMNEDHLDAIRDFYRAGLGVAPEDARMIGVDVYGMDFDSPSAGRLRVDFLRRSSPSSVRKDVIEALKRARDVC